MSVSSILLMKQRKWSVGCKDEECHLSDEGDWRRIKLQVGLRESSFASASAIAPIAIKVSSYNEAVPREHLWRCRFESARFTRLGSAAFTLSCFSMNVSCVGPLK